MTRQARQARHAPVLPPVAAAAGGKALLHAGSLKRHDGANRLHVDAEQGEAREEAVRHRHHRMRVPSAHADLCRHRAHGVHFSSPNDAARGGAGLGADRYFGGTLPCTQRACSRQAGAHSVSVAAVGPAPGCAGLLARAGEEEDGDAGVGAAESVAAVERLLQI